MDRPNYIYVYIINKKIRYYPTASYVCFQKEKDKNCFKILFFFFVKISYGIDKDKNPNSNLTSQSLELIRVRV